METHRLTTSPIEQMAAAAAHTREILFHAFASVSCLWRFTRLAGSLAGGPWAVVLDVGSGNLLCSLEGICLATQFLSQNVESESVHLELTVINVSEKELLLGHKWLRLLDLAERWVFMFEHH